MHKNLVLPAGDEGNAHVEEVVFITLIHEEVEDLVD